MVDKIEEIQKAAPAPEKAPEPARAENTAEQKRAFVSTGEKIHKWGTYLGVDWVMNAALGVGFAYWGKVTESGKKYWSGPLTKFFSKTLSFIKDPKSHKYSVEKGNMFISIIAGGMFTLPPLMLLENRKNKQAIVHSLDNMVYGKETVDNDPKFQQAYQEIETEPKKDFWTGMKSRFAALAPLLTLTVFIPPTRDFTDKVLFKPLSGVSEKVATSMGFKGNKTKNIIASVNEKGEATTAWKFIHDNVAFDAGQGLPYAGLHAMFYNMFADSKAKKALKNQETVETPLEPAATITEIAPEPKKFAEKAEKKEALVAAASHAERELSRKVEAENAPALSA